MTRRLAFLFTLALGTAALAQEAQPLKLAQRIELPGVAGRIDHLACDVAGGRLFVAALGNGSVEVIDLKAGRRVRSIGKLAEPQGLLYEPKSQRLFVASGGDGTCRVYAAARDFAPLATIDAGEDADNVRFIPETNQVLVGTGKGAASGAIAAIDGASLKKTGEVRLDGHAEAFAVEPGGRRVFVNVPTHKQVAAIDWPGQAVAARWPVEGATQNFPLKLDEKNGLLLVGCRQPPAILVLDAATGKSVARIELAADTDDLFYDGARRRIYAICGAGVVETFAQAAPDSYRKTASLASAPGARTGLFVPELGRLFVAAPARDGREAAILVYEAGTQ